MNPTRLRPLMAIAALAALLAGCVVYDPAPGYYGGGPAYAYAPPVYGGVVIGGGGYYGPRYYGRHYWR